MGIITLLFINSTISFIEENNAGNAAAALMARLAPKAKVSNCTMHSFLTSRGHAIFNLSMKLQLMLVLNFFDGFLVLFLYINRHTHDEFGSLFP